MSVKKIKSKLFVGHFYREKSLSLMSIENDYWLKFELIAICKQHQIKTNGTKKELKLRIKLYLKNRITK